jgi:hypothetical protein
MRINYETRNKMAYSTVITVLAFLKAVLVMQHECYCTVPRITIKRQKKLQYNRQREMVES